MIYQNSKNSKAIKSRQIFIFFSGNFLGSRRQGGHLQKQGAIHNEWMKPNSVLMELETFLSCLCKTFTELTQSLHMLWRSFCCCFCFSQQQTITHGFDMMINYAVYKNP